MDIMALIDRIEELIDNGRNVPFSNQRMTDADKIYEIIDEIRAQFPDELKQARWIVKERQEMVEEAESQAAEILDNARAREREIRLGAEDYADEMLANLEVNLGKLLTAVQRGRDRLQGKVSQRA